LVAIERAGPGADGQCRTMRGRVMTSECLAPLHVLFERAREARVSTTGIGDGGNEVGMGKCVEAVRAEIANGPAIACVVGTDHLVCCSVSNWGGYALAGALALLALEQGRFASARDACEACLGPAGEAVKVIQAACAAGARDGVTGLPDTVDGLAAAKSEEVVEAIRRIVCEYDAE
jgi:hypothetical protein